MSQIVQFLEYVTQPQTGLKVDSDAGVIHNVRVIGLTSANGREYLHEAIKKALPLYEGCPVNVDHPTGHSNEIPVARRFGWLEAVRQEDDGGARGDLHYLKSHPMATTIAEAATRRPQLVGLSHNAEGKTRHEQGREIVESIDRVISVDLVADPATVSGLHESKRERPVKKTIREWIEQLKSRPGYVRGLREVAEAGIMPDTAMMDDPGDTSGGETADHETALKQGFRGAIVAVLDDESLDMGGKLKKIKEIMKAEEKLIGGGGDDKSAEPPAETPAMESQRRAQGNLVEQMRLQLKVRDLCSDADVKPDLILRTALDACTSEAQATKLIEAAKARPVQSGARSANPWQDTSNGNDKLKEQRKAEEIPAKGEDFGKWVHSS